MLKTLVLMCMQEMYSVGQGLLVPGPGCDRKDAVTPLDMIPIWDLFGTASLFWVRPQYDRFFCVEIQ